MAIKGNMNLASLFQMSVIYDPTGRTELDNQM